MTFHNPGPFVQELDPITLYVWDLGPDDSEQSLPAISLNPGQTINQNITIPIPNGTSHLVEPGLYEIEVAAKLPHGDAYNNTAGTLYIPESTLQGTVTQLPNQGGDSVEVTLNNTGGVDTTAAYSLKVYDSLGFPVAQASASGLAMPVDTLFWRVARDK